jgi:F-type H+-transporting ATPase subunit alpha
MILYAVINGYMDDIPMAKVAAFEADFYRFMEASHADLGKSIAKTKELSAEAEETLKKAITEFKQGFGK